MADFVILGDYPAFDDKDKQLMCNHGRLLWFLLKSQENVPRDIAVEFLYNSYDDMVRGISRKHAIEAKHKPKVYLALGDRVTKELGVDGKLQKIRGSVYTLDKKWGECYVVPTFNPREYKHPYRVFAEEPIEKGLLAAHDMSRAVKAYHQGWHQEKENFVIDPSLEDLQAFVKESVENKYLLGADIEATGLNIEHAEIVVIGFAKSETDCFVVPLRKEGGEFYWKTERERIEVQHLLNTLFKECSFIFQNGFGYDIPLLLQRGYEFPLTSYTDETMILHHTLSPELPHNIGFISSHYGKQPYWKESFLSRKEHIFETDQTEMKIYNARDCIALHQIRNSMLEYMETIGSDPSVPHYKLLPKVYEDSMAQARVLIKMHKTGITKSESRLKVWQKFASENLEKHKKEMLDLIDVPESFSFSADQDMRLLIYNERPPKLDKKGWKEELLSYESMGYNYQYACTECDRKVTQKFYEHEEVAPTIVKKCPNCGEVKTCKRTEKKRTVPKQKSKDTDAYRKLKALSELEKVKPLYQLRNYSPLKTDKGLSALDKAAIVRYNIAITMRLDKIQSMKRIRPAHLKEKEGLEATRKFLNAYSKFNKFSKLVSTFWDFPTWRDGRIRGSYMPTGTATGRLSMKKPNLQQIPSKEVGNIIRSVFRAGEGKELMSADFTGLEVWVAAYFFMDSILQDMLAKGLNFHDENTKVFFGVDSTSEMWQVLRGAAKASAFARLLYGGSDRGIYTKMIAEVPDCGVTFKGFCEAMQNWLDAHPAFAKMAEELKTLATEHRVALTAGGRVRILQGALNAIKRQALNTPIQGTAAEFVRDDMIEINRRFEEAGLEAEIVLQVHDELIFEYPVAERAEVAKIVKEVMTRERVVKGQTFNLQVDAEVGIYWGEMNSIDLDTLEVAEGSKH